MHRVKDREIKKAEKNEKERSKEKNRDGLAKKKKKKKKKKLMRMRQSKILYIFTWKFHHKLTAVSESAFLAKFREI